MSNHQRLLFHARVRRQAIEDRSAVAHCLSWAGPLLGTAWGPQTCSRFGGDVVANWNLQFWSLTRRAAAYDPFLCGDQISINQS